jgi:DNA repair protein RadB
MQEKRIGSGVDAIDNLLLGGFEAGVITTIYGPSSSGKTNICMLSAIECVKRGKKVLYIDTECGFSFARLKQVCPNYQKIIDKIIFLKPSNFEKQKKAIETTTKVLNNKFGLVVVDSIAMLYRLEMSKNKDLAREINNEVCLQLSYLSEVAQKYRIPVLLTNHVYSGFDDKEVRMVGGDLIKYSSKCLIELKKGRNNLRKAILRKHRSLPEENQVVFRIKETGLFQEKLE